MSAPRAWRLAARRGLSRHTARRGPACSPAAANLKISSRLRSRAGNQNSIAKARRPPPPTPGRCVAVRAFATRSRDERASSSPSPSSSLSGCRSRNPACEAPHCESGFDAISRGIQLAKERKPPTAGRVIGLLAGWEPHAKRAGRCVGVAGCSPGRETAPGGGCAWPRGRVGHAYQTGPRLALLGLGASRAGCEQVLTAHPPDCLSGPNGAYGRTARPVPMFLSRCPLWPAVMTVRRGAAMQLVHDSLASLLAPRIEHSGGG